MPPALFPAVIPDIGTNPSSQRKLGSHFFLNDQDKEIPASLE